MRVLRLLPFVLLLSVPISAQQTTLPGAKRDPQAVSILTQAVSVAGGTAAFSAITDYTASGLITYALRGNLQGTVVLSGRGPSELRMDMSLPTGKNSYVVNGPQTTTANTTEGTDQQNIQAPMMAGNLALPYRELAALLISSQCDLTYNGIVQVDGRSAYEVRVRRTGQHSNASFLTYHTIDFLIDSSTLLLYMTRDAVPRNAAPRQIRYSDYRAVNGVLVPFSIDQEIGGERTFLIHLDQITFGPGLQDSTFSLNSVAQ